MPFEVAGEIPFVRIPGLLNCRSPNEDWHCLNARRPKIMSALKQKAYLANGVELLANGYGFSRADNIAGVLGFGYGWIRRETGWTNEVGLVLLVRDQSPGFPYAYVNVAGPVGEAQVPCCSYVLKPHTSAPKNAADVQGAVAARVGGPISSQPGLATGTAGVAMTGDVLVTAAHVLGPDGNGDLGDPVFAGSNLIGRRSTPLFEHGNPDLAFVKIDASSVNPDLYRRADGLALAGVADVQWSDLHKPASVFRPTTKTVARPWILAAGMTLHLLRRNGSVLTQSDMIMTDGCTEQGDSGTGLVSDDGRVFGILSHGRPEFSFFTAFGEVRQRGLLPGDNT